MENASGPQERKNSPDPETRGLERVLEMRELEELDGHVETEKPNRGKTMADKAKQHGGPQG